MSAVNPEKWGDPPAGTPLYATASTSNNPGTGAVLALTGFADVTNSWSASPLSWVGQVMIVERMDRTRLIGVVSELPQTPSGMPVAVVLSDDPPTGGLRMVPWVNVREFWLVTNDHESVPTPLSKWWRGSPSLTEQESE